MLRLEPTETHLLESPGSAGLDEAGRGPLAGPVVAAAVVLPEGYDLAGIGDSKKLTRAQREHTYARLVAEIDYAVAVAETDEIDERNILAASLAAMVRALNGLRRTPTKALVDGNVVPPGLPCAVQTVVGGDGVYACIAAASIIAKVTRDRMMAEYSAQYPRYGFHKHFGYATAEHLAALREHGPCPIHRRSFSPVREMILQPCLTLE